MGKPAKGKIVYKEPGEKRSEEVAWVKYEKSVKFGFEHPTSFRISEENENRIVMVGIAGRSEQVVVNYREWRESLSELPDVQMRQRKADIYEKTNLVDGWECYAKKEGMERACLKKTETGVISVAMTANSNDEELKNVFERVVGSVETGN